MKYSNLFLMASLSFISMYILMYIMVNRLENVYPNLNQLYMVGIMTVPMIVIELFLMSAMYTNRKLNAVILTSCLIMFIALIFFIRKQTAITDREFLKSMIPHHAGALLMCENASLEDPEILALCKSISSSQQSEIDFMKSKLETLKK
ncbi:MAG: DUF305 domain-containing protein [Candidatus Babeliaceae bacterium]|nr:DUF305 domain-containing protein [Candidatus Babeliaceae bacterium]